MRTAGRSYVDRILKGARSLVRCVVDGWARPSPIFPDHAITTTLNHFITDQLVDPISKMVCGVLWCIVSVGQRNT